MFKLRVTEKQTSRQAKKERTEDRTRENNFSSRKTNSGPFISKSRGGWSIENTRNEGESLSEGGETVTDTERRRGEFKGNLVKKTWPIISPLRCVICFSWILILRTKKTKKWQQLSRPSFVSCSVYIRCSAQSVLTLLSISSLFYCNCEVEQPIFNEAYIFLMWIVWRTRSVFFNFATTRNKKREVQRKWLSSLRSSLQEQERNEWFPSVVGWIRAKLILLSKWRAFGPLQPAVGGTPATY